MVVLSHSLNECRQVHDGTGGGGGGGEEEEEEEEVVVVVATAAVVVEVVMEVCVCVRVWGEGGGGTYQVLDLGALLHSHVD